MTTKLRKSTWNTYATTGYTHQVGSDQRATGGVHLHQVRKSKAGWQRRTLDANGRFESSGAVTPITDADGEAYYAQAQR